MARRLLLTLLIGALAVVLALTGTAFYVRGELEDRDAFTARATSVLADPDVRAVIAGRIVDAVVATGSPEVLAVRPLVATLAGGVVATPPFRRAFALAVADAHDQLVGERGSVVIEVNRAIPVLLEAARGVSPRVAEVVPRVQRPLVDVQRDDLRRAGVGPLDDLSAARWWLALAAAGLTAAVVLTARALPRAIERVGVAAVGGGLGVAAALTIAKAVALSHSPRVAGVTDDQARGAVAAVWDALLGDLRTAGLIGALAGAVLVAAAHPVRVRAVRAALTVRGRRLVRSPAPAARLARGGLLVAAGIALLSEPDTLLRLAVGIAAVALLLAGVIELVGPAPPPEPIGEPAAAPPRARTLRARRAGLVVAAAAALAVAVAVIVRTPDTGVGALAAPVRSCNGSPALCGRRLDQVVFPGTHNSYAAADEPGWLFANQRFGIERQLADGIRSLLIDIHYGAPDPQSGRVRTDIDAEGTTRNKVALELSPEALRTADRLVERVGLGRLDGPPRLYLCHTLCELGAEPIDEQLAIVRRFLDADPGAVLIVFVEPYVSVDEIERAFERAGLADDAARLRTDRPLPTLGELVDANTRLVLLAEEDGGKLPWYLPGFSFAQDTPLGATEGSELRCSRFRGTPDAPLFLLNHWIDVFPPSPSRNERIGGAFLRDRIERCERARKQLPNLVAVDFYERSGVVDLAAERNAEPPAAGLRAP